MSRPTVFDAALWAGLVPLLLLVRPYEGLIQDARIYIGRGVADRDPAGIGRDPMFVADGQTGFTAFRPLVRGLLEGLTAPQASMALAGLGSLLWLAAAVALGRSLARGRSAWAAVVSILALQADYGAFNTFVYGEAVATPRVFAEAAVLAALAGLVGGRRLAPLALLGVAAAFHPLMALPGLGIAAAILVSDDRRWLVPVAGGALGLAIAAALRIPPADRLLLPMDEAWLGALKERSVNLFPSLWNPGVFARIAARAAAAVVFATLAPPRVRKLLYAALGVGLAGLGATILFGDRVPLVLVTQSQTWRALWPLAVLGNGSLALAALGLWRGGPGARVTLACLGLSWLSIPVPALAILLAVATVALRVADVRGRLGQVSARVACLALAAVAALALLDAIVAGVGLALYVRAARDQSGELVYAFMLAPGAHAWPLVVGALALALSRPTAAAARPGSRVASSAAVLAVVAAAAAAVAVWDSRTVEYRMAEAGGAPAAALRDLLGPEPGAVLWLDDYDEAWFLADRPSFFSSVQGCPILFSRPLAMTWRERGRSLVSLGLARPRDLSPWAEGGHRVDDLALAPASLEAVCRAPDHPAAIVAPGSQLAAVPRGWSAGLWTPPARVPLMFGDDAGVHWRQVATYTVVRCPARGPTFDSIRFD